MNNPLLRVTIKYANNFKIIYLNIIDVVFYPKGDKNTGVYVCLKLSPEHYNLEKYSNIYVQPESIYIELQKEEE